MRAFFAFIVATILSIVSGKAALSDEPIMSGTAFIVSPDGWFLTNAHVVSKCTRVEVKGLGFANLPKVDEINDLAAIHVTSAKPLAPVKFRKNPVRLGEDIVAVGFPLTGMLSDSIKVTTGNINSLAGIGNDTRYVQISTPIQPGNSGGPIVDRQGMLLGITSATFSKDAADKIGITAQNLNFAIRSSVAELFLQSQGLNYVSAEAQNASAPLATADLADKITPSVYPVLCYSGAPASASSAEAVSQVAGVPRSVQPVLPPSLIDADGYDAVGFDYSTLKSIAYDGCKAACESDSQCMAITYNKHYNVCFLKRDVAALIRNSEASTAYSSAKSSQVVFSSFTVYRDMDYPGGDYLRLRRSDYSQCLTACIKDNVCKAFSYVRRKNECWLKSTLGASRHVSGVELGLK
jgi:hypothetical protein